jgi:hypothetical protein
MSLTTNKSFLHIIFLLLPIVQPIEPQLNQERSFFLLQTFSGNRDFGCEIILVHTWNEGEKPQKHRKV